MENKKRFYLQLGTTGVLLVAIFTTLLILWARTTTPVRAEGAPEEQILNYMAGNNFVIHGFLDRGFLTDYSLDPVPEAPAIYYTHFPPLPSIFIGAMISIGIDDLSGIRLVMNLIFIVGLIFTFLFFGRQLTPWHGIGVLLFIGLNNRSILAYSDHVVYAFWFGLTFLAFWALSRHKEGRGYLWLGLAAVFLISLINYVQLIFTLVALGGFWLLRLPNFSLKRVLFAGISGIAGVLVHIFQNILVLGWDIATKELIYTLGNRIAGVPSRDALLDFSLENDLVLWGVKELAPLASRFNWLWVEYKYYLVPWLISLAGIGLLMWYRRRTVTLDSLKIIAVMTVASVAWHIIFEAHGQAYQLSIAVAFPVALTCGLFLAEIVNFFTDSPGILTESIHNYKKGLIAAGLIVAGLVTLWQGITLGMRDITREPHIAMVGELEILREYEGEGFWTNVTPHLVSYYTNSWVVGHLPLDAVKEMDPTQAFVTTVSENSPTWDQVSKPKYFFLSRHNVIPLLEDRGDRFEIYQRYLEDNFPLLATSPYGSMIFDVSWGAYGTSRLTRGVQDIQNDHYTRINLTPSQITSSAALPDKGVENLLTAGGYWAIAPETTASAWLEFDLSEPYAVAGIRIKARESTPEELFEGDSTLVEVSFDGIEWEPLTVLGLDRENPGEDWITFPINTTEEYRYYRITFRDPGFSSLGQLEFYTYR